MKRETQAGVSETTIAELVRSSAIRSAVPPRTQPHQPKPTIIVKSSRGRRPQNVGLSHELVICIEGLHGSGEAHSSPVLPIRP
jgi:hypothetical protein